MWRHGRLCTHQRTATLRPLQGTVLYDPSLAAPVEMASAVASTLLINPAVGSIVVQCTDSICHSLVYVDLVTLNYGMCVCVCVCVCVHRCYMCMGVTYIRP